MNKYEKEARLYPAIAGMIIPIILTTWYVTSFVPETIDVWKSIIAKIGLLIPVALIYGALAYWMRQLFIDASKLLFQFRLFKEDETEMPTTKRLLWRRDMRKSETEIKQIAAKVKADFGIQLLSKDEELANPSEAKRAIVDAVGKIREVTRKNENLQQYNRKYGFCRNYLGACVYAIGTIILALIVNLILDMPYTRILLVALFVQVLFGLIDYTSYKSKANDYARAMYNAYITGEEYERD